MFTRTGLRERRAPKCGSSSADVEIMPGSDGQRSNGVRHARASCALAQLNRLAALLLSTRRAFKTAALTAGGSVATSMMGGALLEASGAVATGGPRSEMAEVRVKRR